MCIDFFEVEEPERMYNQCEVHAGKGSNFDVFWKKPKEFLTLTKCWQYSRL